jgi:hypothetical protein
MAKTPKVGDQRPIGECPLCGGVEYEVYERATVYGDNVPAYWKVLRHEYGDRKLCIAELARRIEALEPKNKPRKTTPYALTGGKK